MRTILAIVLAATLLAGCASNTTPSTSTTTSTTTTPTTTTAGAPPVLAYTAKQNGTGANQTYAFEGPATAAPGWTAFDLTNAGSEAHQITVIKLPAGQTFAQHVAMMKGETAASNDTMDMGTHANATYVGGVAIALPGKTERTTVHLTAGTYVLECDIPGPSGPPHAMMGMMKELTVSGAENGAAEPTADLTLALKEYQFNWSAKPAVGHHVVKIVNVGKMAHEGPVFALAANKTMQDFFAWSAAPQGPPPVTGGFGGAALSPGEVQYASETFAAGSYGEACFLPDEKGTPHFLDGMVDQFVVAA